MFVQIQLIGHVVISRGGEACLNGLTEERYAKRGRAVSKANRNKRIWPNGFGSPSVRQHFYEIDNR